MTRLVRDKEIKLRYSAAELQVVEVGATQAKKRLAVWLREITLSMANPGMCKTKARASLHAMNLLASAKEIVSADDRNRVLAEVMDRLEHAFVEALP